MDYFDLKLETMDSFRKMIHKWLLKGAFKYSFESIYLNFHLLLSIFQQNPANFMCSHLVDLFWGRYIVGEGKVGFELQTQGNTKDAITTGPSLEGTLVIFWTNFWWWIWNFVKIIIQLWDSSVAFSVLSLGQLRGPIIFESLKCQNSYKYKEAYEVSDVVSWFLDLGEFVLA